MSSKNAKKNNNEEEDKKMKNKINNDHLKNKHDEYFMNRNGK